MVPLETQSVGLLDKSNQQAGIGVVPSNGKSVAFTFTNIVYGQVGVGVVQSDSKSSGFIDTTRGFSAQSHIGAAPSKSKHVGFNHESNGVSGKPVSMW